MTKQTQLRDLLQELENATRHHERCNNYSTTPSFLELNLAVQRVDVAEKRIFSLLDALTKDRDQARAEVSNRGKIIAADKDRIVELERQIASLQAHMAGLERYIDMRNPPIAAPQPFDEAKARAGEPIQVLYKNEWCDGAVYVGRDPKRGHVVNCEALRSGSSVLSYWGEDGMRMAPPKLQTVQMFANVYETTRGVTWGALTMMPKQHGSSKSLDRVVIAADVPVTITVAK